MRKRSLLIFIISFCVGLFHMPKRQKRSESIDPLFFAGTWFFTDQRGHQHEVKIGPDLKLVIDGENLEANVSEIQKYEVTYVDRYGYKLKIQANEARPIKFFDESENCAYNLCTTKEAL